MLARAAGGLPAIPHLGPHRAHVAHGQHEEQAQAFGGLDDVRDVEDGLGVLDVPPEGGLADQQVVLSQDVVWMGNKCVKDVAGYSLKDLFIGSGHFWASSQRLSFD